MNANNIHLGQTRQHEKNAYSFTKDEKYIVLLPWKESKVMCDPLKAEAIVPHTILLQAMREPPVELALMVLQVCEIEELIPNDMQPCYEEFHDVFTNSLPPVVPPLREIKHVMDLTSRSMLPNQPTYQIQPTKYEAL